MTEAAIRRGDIWLVDFGNPVGREQGFTRPSAVVSADEMNSMGIGLVYVIPATSKARIRKATGRVVPNHHAVEPSPENGLTTVTYFMCEQLRSISTDSDRLVRRLGRLTGEDMGEIERRLKWLLALS